MRTYNLLEAIELMKAGAILEICQPYPRLVHLNDNEELVDKSNRALTKTMTVTELSTLTFFSRTPNACGDFVRVENDGLYVLGKLLSFHEGIWLIDVGWEGVIQVADEEVLPIKFCIGCEVN